PSQPSAATLALHRQAQKALAPGQSQSLLREAGRGFMLQLPFFGVIKDKSGQTVLDLSPYDFLKSGEAPASVHPRLWLQARLLMEGGLFKVAERIYQVRGADFANMTLIEGKTGLIVVDPLSSVETAQLALGLYYACRPGLPVAAVVYTGASPDRYGGAEGICPPEDVKAGRVRVIAPAGFMRRVLAGAMLEGFARSRRLGFERGDFLAPGPLGQVGADAGMRSAEGLSALLPPTEFVGPGRTRLAVDGLTLEFFAEGEGALPGSMHCYIPELKALLAPQAAMPALAGDEAAGLAGPAGAFGEPDLLGWSRSLEDALRHARDAEVMFGARCWPVVGRDAVRTRLAQARDLWRYVHDQTLHLAGQGLGPEAIAQRLRLPEDLAPSLRLAGTPLADIVEAFWRRSFGAVEANPLRMRFFGPSEEGARYVAFMGGPGEVVAKARACMEAGEYRWAVQVLGHVVAAYPGIVPARLLCAEALEQLAYQEEGARRRNLYLSAARELRGGVLPAGRGFLAMASRMAPEDMGAYLALLVNGEKAK
ncbi:MAG: MBL fold metallo-hydrolase, partial [Desulfovibrio sp.]|nr:MBL fold metallo-hydrolase [Desulfovibrio sp.]